MRIFKCNKTYRICIIFLITFSISVPIVSADAMFRANPEHSGVYDNGRITPSNTELWRFTTGGAVASSPAVWNGVVYVGSNDDNLYAIDMITGLEKWRFTTGDDIFSSPAVSNGVVYIGSGDNNLYAVDAVTGLEKWHFTMVYDIYSSPAISNGVVYIGDESGHVSAIDAITGTQKWSFKTNYPLYSSPSVSNGTVFIGCGGVADNNKNLYAIDAATGQEKWHFMAGYSSVASSPTVSDGVVYVGSNDKNLYAVDAVTGLEKWRFTAGDSIISSPALSNGVIYVGSLDKNLYAVDAVTGLEKWRFTTGNYVSSSPAVSNGVVYIGSEDKNLYAVDAATGIEKWRFTTGENIFSSPAVSNGIVYVGSGDKYLYAIGAGTVVATMAPTAIPGTIPIDNPTTNPTKISVTQLSGERAAAESNSNILMQAYNWIISIVGNHDAIQNSHRESVVASPEYPTPQPTVDKGEICRSWNEIYNPSTGACDFPSPQPTYDAEADCRRLDGYYNRNTGECHSPLPPEYYQPASNQQYLLTPTPTIPIVYKDYNSYSQPQRTFTPSPTQTSNIYLNYLQNYPTVAPVINQQTIPIPLSTTPRQFEPVREITYSVPTPIYETGQPVATPLILNTNCQSGYRRDFNGKCVKELSTTIPSITQVTSQVCGGGNHPMQVSTLEKWVPDPQPQTNVGITSPVTLSMRKITVTVICIYDTNICNYRCKE